MHHPEAFFLILSVLYQSGTQKSISAPALISVVDKKKKKVMSLKENYPYNFYPM